MAGLTLVLSDRTVVLPEPVVKDERAAGIKWLEDWAKNNGHQPKTEEANGEATRNREEAETTTN